MKADAVTKDYISDAEIFADVFNYYIYGGRQAIRPEQLSECDSTEIALPYGKGQAAVPIQKYRDAQKLCAAKTDGEMEYVLYGAESQARIHYAMPVKNNLYDALEYAGQVEAAARSHRREMERQKKGAVKEGEDAGGDAGKKPDSGEFLSGFWREDRLIPSVTLTIYFGSERWDGPMSLFEMMKVPNPEVLACMDDYHVRLIAPAQMEDSEIMKFQSSLREVMLFIKYSKDKEGLDRVLRMDEDRFRNLERRAADVIEAITNSGIKYDEKDEVVNVCQAIHEMRMESERIGELRGEQRGEQKGELKKARETAVALYEMGDGIEKISRCVGYAVETVRQWLGISNG